MQFDGDLVIDSRMCSPSIVIDFYVLKHGAAGLFIRGVMFVMHLLFLQRGEETFGHGVVPTISFATHAANQAVLVEQITMLATGILRATVAVHDAATRHMSALGNSVRCASIQAYFTVHPAQSTPWLFLGSHNPISLDAILL